MEGGTVEFSVGGRQVVLAGSHEPYLRHLSVTDWSNHRLFAEVARLRAGDFYLDIGSNIGATAIAVALIRPDIRVVAFEPVPSNFEFLSRNVRANGVRNCTVVRAAVGDIRSQVALTDAGPWSLVLPERTMPNAPLVPLDEYCGGHLRDARISFLKIDVEGYEPNVLAGASEVIRRFRPTIYMEFNSWTLIVQGYNPIAFAQYLVEAFRIEPLPGVDTGDALSLAQENMIHHGCVFDITMRPREQTPPVSLGELKFGGVSLSEAKSGGVSPGELSLEALNQKLADEVRALRASTSWRITAPLRAFKAMVSGRR